MFDIFSIAFQESKFKNLKLTEPKFIFQPMSLLGIVYIPSKPLPKTYHKKFF